MPSTTLNADPPSAADLLEPEPRVPEPRIEVFGIRHHGPGSARSLLAALDDFRPDAVLIEGPADANPLLHWAAAAQMEPPVALLAYADDQPDVAAFWPYAEFSPEWQAVRWALRRDIEVRFCDLPANVVLARSRRPVPPVAPPVADHDHPRDDLEKPHPEAGDPVAGELGAGDPDAGDLDVGAQRVDGVGSDDPAEPEAVREADAHRTLSRDPLALLAGAAGYDDAERWWDDVVESRLDGSSPFPALTEAMAELRSEVGEPDRSEALNEARREAYMRQTIRAAVKGGRTRVAVVCGAWHAPALMAPMPTAAADAKILRNLPKRKVSLTWVPWTHDRLASATGYGAGVTSPGWYHHLWSAPDQPVVRWLTKVAHALRDRDLAVSSAHVIEAVRLAETLAGLRRRPLAGLAEVTDATRAVLCDGNELAVRFVTDQLVVGQRIGAVDPGVPTVPLEADLIARCRRLRVKREPQPRRHDLDLRKPFDQEKSKLFHRLRLLGLTWIAPADSGIQGTGTFRETWESRWRPELSIAVVEASVWGTTVETAASAKVEQVVAGGTLAELTATVERCLLADLPGTLARLLRALEAKAALDVDVVHLMDALPPLARAQRYGDVRSTDTSALAHVSAALLLRICVGLPQAVAGLDDEAAAVMRRRIDAVHASVSLLGGSAGGDPRPRWWSTLMSTLDRADVNPQLSGRIVRILADAEVLDDADLRVERALSHGVDAAAKASWVDGFFADGALLLIHDDTLRSLLDDWVGGLAAAEFVDLMPLIRRTFGTFGVAERRSIAGRIVATDVVERPGELVEPYDFELAAAALATVAAILSPLERSSPSGSPETAQVDRSRGGGEDE